MEREGNAVLPAEFIERMQKLLGEDCTEFLESYEKERLYGLRYNPLKATREDLPVRL